MTNYNLHMEAITGAQRMGGAVLVGGTMMPGRWIAGLIAKCT